MSTEEERYERHVATKAALISNPADLAAAYGLPWPADACNCCGGKIIDGHCLGAAKCDNGYCGPVAPAGLTDATAEAQP